EKRDGPIGHEYQLMGEPDLAAAQHDLRHATASFYDVLPPSESLPLRPVGTWNSSRIVVRGNHVEHWLNGSKGLPYELGSEAVRVGKAASKFKDIADFGTKFAHPLLLQDHGGEIRFRNLKLRTLKD